LSTPGRNDPCPCGSGLKYKKCHGAAAPAAPEASPTTAAIRPCGDCSLCCDGWLKTRVLEQDIGPGHPCPYSDGKHCTIHETRPVDPCRVFFCGWAKAGSHLPDWMQPNQCGVIVLTGRSAWRGQPVDVLVSAGRDPEPRVLEWYQAHSIRHVRPFIYQQGEEWFGFGPPAFQQEIAARASRGEPLWT